MKYLLAIPWAILLSILYIFIGIIVTIVEGIWNFKIEFTELNFGVYSRAWYDLDLSPFQSTQYYSGYAHYKSYLHYIWGFDPL